MSAVPVMVRGGLGHAPTRYRLYGEYETFAEAAGVVQSLRQTPGVAGAHIPNEYAYLALSCPPPEEEK